MWLDIFWYSPHIYTVWHIYKLHISKIMPQNHCSWNYYKHDKLIEILITIRFCCVYYIQSNDKAGHSKIWCLDTWLAATIIPRACRAGWIEFDCGSFYICAIIVPALFSCHMTIMVFVPNLQSSALCFCQSAFVFVSSFASLSQLMSVSLSYCTCCFCIYKLQSSIGFCHLAISSHTVRRCHK